MKIAFGKIAELAVFDDIKVKEGFVKKFGKDDALDKGKIYLYKTSALKIGPEKKSDNKQLNLNFFAEAVMTAIVESDKNTKMQLAGRIRYGSRRGSKYCLPRLLGVYVTSDGRTGMRTELVGDALAMKISSIQARPDPADNLRRIVIQTACLLWVLQRTLKFTHRDLHSWNVSVRRLTGTGTPFVFKMGEGENTVNISFQTKYEVGLYDLGQSCLEKNGVVYSIPMTTAKANMISTCQNRSFDLKLLMTNLQSKVPDPIPLFPDEAQMGDLYEHSASVKSRRLREIKTLVARDAKDLDYIVKNAVEKKGEDDWRRMYANNKYSWDIYTPESVIIAGESMLRSNVFTRSSLYALPNLEEGMEVSKVEASPDVNEKN